MNIKLDPTTKADLRELTRLMNARKVESVPPMTIAALAGMLLKDAAMVVSRPGCCEASNLYQVLVSHGYLHG